MEVLDDLLYGQQTLLHEIAQVPEDRFNMPGVCGVWSVNDVIAHLASYEHLLVDVLCGVIGDADTPTLDLMMEVGGQVFNDEEVGRRQGHTTAELMDELKSTYAEAHDIARQIPAEVFRKIGTLPWYGAAYSLDDYITYTFYGHKREHSAQIAAFCDQLNGHGPLIGRALAEEQAAQTRAAVERLNEALNAHDLEAVISAFGNDGLFDNTSPAPDGEVFQGQNGLRQFWSAFLHDNPQAHFSAEEVFAAGERCVVRWVYTWDREGGAMAHVRGVDILRVDGGKVAEKRAYVKG